MARYDRLSDTELELQIRNISYVVWNLDMSHDKEKRAFDTYSELIRESSSRKEMEAIETN